MTGQILMSKKEYTMSKSRVHNVKCNDVGLDLLREKTTDVKITITDK